VKHEETERLGLSGLLESFMSDLYRQTTDWFKGHYSQKLGELIIHCTLAEIVRNL